jgi:hypothetical protein
MSTPERHQSEQPTSFRTTVAEARREIVAREGVPGPLAESDGQKRRSFEVRIEKRRSRRLDESQWNKLGRDGWELVAVSGKHAYFRRGL